MKGHKAGLIALAVLASAALQAPGAAAKPVRIVIPGTFELAAKLPNSHGYSVSITSNDHRHVELKAARGLQVIIYSVVGRATSKGFDADFGRFGYVSLRFHAPQRKTDSSPQLCPGRPTVHEVGTMRGSIRFTGADGLPTVSATRVRAEATHSFRQVCVFGPGSGDSDTPLPEPQPHPHEPAARLLQRLAKAQSEAGESEAILEGLVAKRQTNTGELTFAAASVPELLAFVVSSARETVGRVRVSRNTFTIAGPHVLKLSEPGASPQTARVKVPAPFNGRGDYVKAPGEESWSGSLRVPIIGRGTVSLTGPEFDVTTCRARTKKEAETCTNLVFPEPPGDGYGSGSHSQALADARLSWSR